MREIKFRAWDKVNKRMGYFKSGFQWNNEYNLWYIEPIDNADITDVPCEDNIELMQFTGLKDRNGKEIYEGDIVELHNWGWKDKSKIGVAKIVFNEHYMKFEFNMIEGHEIEDEYDLFRTTPEVIGNIYENPELVK